MRPLSKLIAVEMKLFLRDPGSVVIALGLPTVLLGCSAAFLHFANRAGNSVGSDSLTFSLRYSR